MISNCPIGEFRFNRDQGVGTIRAVSFGDGRKGGFRSSSHRVIRGGALNLGMGLRKLAKTFFKSKLLKKYIINFPSIYEALFNSL